MGNGSGERSSHLITRAASCCPGNGNLPGGKGSRRAAAVRLRAQIEDLRDAQRRRLNRLALFLVFRARETTDTQGGSKTSIGRGPCLAESTPSAGGFRRLGMLVLATAFPALFLSDSLAAAATPLPLSRCFWLQLVHLAFVPVLDRGSRRRGVARAEGERRGLSRAPLSGRVRSDGCLFSLTPSPDSVLIGEANHCPLPRGSGMRCRMPGLAVPPAGGGVALIGSNRRGVLIAGMGPTTGLMARADGSLCWTRGWSTPFPRVHFLLRARGHWL